MFYIYIIYSASSDRYYVGYTDNIDRRLSEHNISERVTFTSKHRPWVLKALFESGSCRSTAMKYERLIKKQKSRLYIEMLIHSEKPAGELAQLVRVPTSRD